MVPATIFALLLRDMQADLFADDFEPTVALSSEEVVDDLKRYTWRDRATAVAVASGAGSESPVPVLTNEYWTSRQRAANNLHEISYRACFKPQLPRFFISRLTQPGDCVYDPFAGRGTTMIEAALLGRAPAGCDVNPLSASLILPRLAPPTLREVLARLHSLDLRWHNERPEELLTFYHPETLAELCALRRYLLDRDATGHADAIDDWIRMVAINRLTGHSRGFLSVYTLPPNQAVTVEAQRKINADRQQIPPRRDVRAVIAQKTRSLLNDIDEMVRRNLARARESARFRTGQSDALFWEPGSVALVVTSPPFLDVVDYATDNWLRCWFCDIDSRSIDITTPRRIDEWQSFITAVFAQLLRLLRPGGFVAFEVGEVRHGRLRLDDAVLPCGRSVGLIPVCVIVNQQTFTKTANIWGVSNNAKGTNSNRIVLFRKPA